ncbi:hypothetical protein ScalyP_jg2307 [Parmales sp. scaly parma]|nr:hypothetical protein ScalyP_jg2307 [Parmales sp. scaly parma]|tara:strand:- start:288 stop:875 length:588 start_codon:yes stop_codon:yes gene_type:complete
MAKGKKDKGKKAEGDGSAALTKEDELKQIKNLLFSMEKQIDHRTEKKDAAVVDQKAMMKKMKEVNERYEQNVQDTDDITKDMTRQYKSMQEELMNKINLLEGTIHELQDELESDRSSFQRTLKEKDTKINNKDAEIAGMKLKMDDMAAEFETMLKETLNKMKERIELNSQNFEEQAVPMQRRLETFNLSSKAEAK